MKPRDFSEYHKLVLSEAKRAISSDKQVCEAPSSVALGVPAARLLLDDDPSLHLQLGQGMRALAAMGRGQGTPRLIGAHGDQREEYHLLVLHLHLGAFSHRYESMSQQVWSACEDSIEMAIQPARAAETFTAGPPPAARAATTIWQAMCLYEAGRLLQRDVDVEVAESIVHQVLSQPGPDGSFAERDPEESPDAWTYRELVGIHALANMALFTRNRQWAARVERIALHHLENTQPDHTTGEPWGLFAFLWSEKVRTFGEQQLHDAASYTSQAGGGPGIAAMLLADAARCLSMFVP
jgi:hypothetical protein